MAIVEIARRPVPVRRSRKGTLQERVGQESITLASSTDERAAK